MPCLAAVMAAHVPAMPPPTTTEITEAFWGACHGGQLATAQHLLTHGADMNWVGWDNLTPLGAAERSTAEDVVAWLTRLGGQSTD